jgi:uncharacterized protein YdaU (DUF1376 family)
VTKESKPDAWMPLYIGDWDGDTGHLDCEQDGAYGRLVRWYWRNGPPKDDDGTLSRIIRMPLGRWRKIRPILAEFFTVSDGVWRHKRVDEELVRWAEKRARAIERAAAGGRAKAAKSSATSTPQALLKGCTSASSREEEGPYSPSSLSGQNEFLGPKEVRDAFLAKLGDEWCRSYLDHCAWQDVPERALIPATKYAGTKLIRDARQILSALGLSVLERAA